MTTPTFHVRGILRRLSRPQARGPYQIRFQLNGRDRGPFSLRTTDLKEAKSKATRLIEDSYAAAAGDQAAAARLTTAPFATIGQVIDRYRPDPRDVKAATAAKNVSSLLRLLAIDWNPCQTKARLRSHSSQLLTAQLVERYQEQALARGNTERSINSTVLQARSVLAPNRMDLYTGLRLPDLAAFRSAPLLRVETDCSFVPFPAGTVDAIAEATQRMPRDLRLAALLMIRCGLRNIEIEHAKWEWFRDLADGTYELLIQRRSYFQVKNGSVRILRLPADLVEQLRPFWGAPNDWIIDRETPTERYNATHDELNAWLRPLLPGRQKAAYELRKHAGSVILTRPEGDGGGLAAAARFLGDTIATTERHYARYLRPIVAVGAVELRIGLTKPATRAEVVAQ